MTHLCIRTSYSKTTCRLIKSIKLALLVIISISVFACANTNAVRYKNSSRSDSDTINGYLQKPDGDGPFPAVVLLHGCTGLERDEKSMPYKGLLRYQSLLKDAGFVSLIPDSYGSRGKSTHILWYSSCPKYRVPEREADLTGAIRYLKSLPYVNGRIGAVGLSQGGMLVLTASGWHEGPYRKQLIHAAVAIYPPCTALPPKDVRIPLLVLIGEADDITPADNCERWLNGYKKVIGERLDENGRQIGILPELVIYPGEVHHSYDLPMPGNWVTPIGTVGPNAKAFKDTKARMIDFFKKNLDENSNLSGEL